MSIVCGFDVHREQITFDVLDQRSGEVRTGRIAPATRVGLHAWLASLDSSHLRVALEATTGWRFVVEELERAGAQAVLAEPAETRALRGPKRRAKTDRADARHLRELLEREAVPRSWIPPVHLQELRTLVRLRHSLAAERRVWLQRVQAQLFHQGAAPVRGRLLGPQGAAASALFSPAGRELVHCAERVCTALEREIAQLDERLAVWARRHPACRALQKLYGVGPTIAVTLYAEIGDARRLGSSRKLVRLAGLDRIDEPGNSCRGEGTQELLEWPGRAEVGGLLLERCSDRLRVEVVEVEQEVVGVDRFDAERLACLGREVVDVEGDDQLGVGGDCGGEDVPVLLVVGHRRLEQLELCEPQ